MLGIAGASPLFSEMNPTLCNPLLGPRQDDRFTLQFEGEFMYLLPYSALTYILTGQGESTAAGNPPINVPVNGRPYGPDWTYQSGFRVSGASYFGNDNSYDITARYSRFSVHGKGSFLTADHPQLALTVRSLGGFLSEPNATRLSIHNADIEAEFPENFADLMGGYSIDVSKNLYFRPFAGLSAYWTDIKIEANYAFFNPTASGPVGEEQSHTKCSSTAWGIGPICGLDGSWSLTRNLSLFGAFEFSVRYIEWKMKVIQQEVRLTAPGGTFDLVRGKIDSNIIGFSRNMLLGPQLDFWFARNRYHLMLRAAWQWVLNDGAYHGYANATVGESYFVNEMQGLNASASFEF